jgi:hypothetical protein
MRIDRMETFYKTPSATPPIEEAEYYCLLLYHEEGNDSAFYLQKTHGWWDNHNRRAQNNYIILNPDEGLSHNEALSIFDEQVKQCVSTGFCHCRPFDPFNPNAYRNLCP